MADLNIVIRKEIKDDTQFADVYISVAHNKATRYIKTEYKVNKKGVKSTINRLGKVKQEVKDPFVYKSCMELIYIYAERFNKLKNASKLSCNDLIKYLKMEDEEISFTGFAREYIKDLKKLGRRSSANNYEASLNSFLKFININEITFSDISTKMIKDWIKSLMETNRARNMYPTHLKALFYRGTDYYNQYDKGVILIPYEPFKGIKFPKEVTPEKRAIDVKTLRNFFNNAIISERRSYNSKFKESAQRMTYDVAKMIFFLAGINAADLYYMEKSSLHNDWKLCYNRHKTMGKRDDKAYIEITVPEEIRPLFKKYKGKNRLFYFSERYSDENYFVRYLRDRLVDICKKNKMENVTTYTFRHSWATIAQNKCGASDELVAFCLNHASKYKITKGYIMIDYSPIDKMNRKVIDYVFGENVNQEEGN